MNRDLLSPQRTLRTQSQNLPNKNSFGPLRLSGAFLQAGERQSHERARHETPIHREVGPIRTPHFVEWTDHRLTALRRRLEQELGVTRAVDDPRMLPCPLRLALHT